MKHLFLLPLLLVSSVYSQEVQEISLSDKELQKKFVAVLKNQEVESLIDKSNEFKDCKAKIKDVNGVKDYSEVDNCFKDVVSKKGKAEVEKLSSQLGLQSHGVVQSANVKEITEYLSDRLYKVMSGVDRKEADAKKRLESMKFANRKVIDQKDFIDMYSTQLGKNALFEISRFCFENFRIENKDVGANDFVTYWNGFFTSPDNTFNSAVTDTGHSEQFGDFKGKTSSKDDIYKEISKGISSTELDPKKMGAFFGFCSGHILPLCKAYREKKRGDIGANACIVEAKLQEIRKAISNTAKVAEQFKEMSATEITLALSHKSYDRGSSNDQESIDNLTNFSSADFLSDKEDEKAKKCADKAESPECEGFLVISDDSSKAQDGMELSMRLKKQLEIKKILELKNDEPNLKKYLEDNGYFELIKEIDTNGLASLTEADLENKIGEIFDARRKAMIKNIKETVGKRQMSQDELEKSGDDGKRFQKGNAESALEERARLAQVVLFNNIITSNLELEDAATKEVIGRNSNAWLKEQKSLDANKVDQTLFSGLKNAAESSGKLKTNDKSIVGIGMLDEILGKK